MWRLPSPQSRVQPRASCATGAWALHMPAPAVVGTEQEGWMKVVSDLIGRTMAGLIMHGQWGAMWRGAGPRTPRPDLSAGDISPDSLMHAWPAAVHTVPMHQPWVQTYSDWCDTPHPVARRRQGLGHNTAHPSLPQRADVSARGAVGRGCHRTSLRHRGFPCTTASSEGRFFELPLAPTVWVDNQAVDKLPPYSRTPHP